MENFKCKECDNSYETLKGLSSHRFQKHRVKPHLIRFWEDDINNNLINVINTLKLLL